MDLRLNLQRVLHLDFPGAVNAMGRSVIEVNQGNLKSVNVVQAGGRSRVVLNLKQPTTYRAELQGKAVLIQLDPVAAIAAAQAPQAAVFAEAGTTDVMPIKDVDFRRGPDGSGRVIVGLASSQVGVDLRQVGKGLTIDFTRSSLPKDCAADWTLRISEHQCKW
jgi:type IV pilus assembly protein PilQ